MDKYNNDVWAHNFLETCKIFQRENFSNIDEALKEVYRLRDDEDKQALALESMNYAAQECGIDDFKEQYARYSNARSGKKVTKFTNQPIELLTGSWDADDQGVRRPGRHGDEYACHHPLTLTGFVRNLATGVEQVEIAFKRGRGNWKTIIVDRKTVASKTHILDLSAYGVGVTSETARLLVQYISDLENFNFEVIPQKNSIDRCGWYDGQFIPFAENMILDAENSFAPVLSAIKEAGDFDLWLNAAREVRKGGAAGQIALAASFASVLVEPLQALNFFVHAWGGTGTGKTVLLMLAASVWGNPAAGRLWATFDSTGVGSERRAGFLYSLPLLFDELQIIAERPDFDQILYSLAEGVGRVRGSRSGGLQQVHRWHNVILSTGEMPITSGHSGGGAVNRVLEFECTRELFPDPHGLVELILQNHGHAGAMFVKRLQQGDGMERARALFKSYTAQLRQHDTTDKQIQSAALILAADALLTEWIFQDDAALTVRDLLPFLKSRKEVDSNLRAYHAIIETLVANRYRFDGNVQRLTNDKSEIWGAVPDGGNGLYIIIKKRFDEICKTVPINPQAFLSWAKQHNLLELTTKGYTKNQRFGNESLACVWLKVPCTTEEQTADDASPP